MKKFLAITLCLLMVLCVFASCGEKEEEKKETEKAAETTAAEEETTAADETEPAETEPADEPAAIDPAIAEAVAEGDAKTIVDKGVLVVGITDFAPMNYRDDAGEWTGFDTEFAQAVGKKLGVDVEFREIVWENKWLELESGKIDCVWNGMTISQEVYDNSNCTDAYAMNGQVIVMNTAKSADYKDLDSMKDLKFAVESGSAGQEAGTGIGLNVEEYTSQADAVMAVSTNKVDGCIIDLTMAKAMTGEGTSYADLGIILTLTEEEYGIAFRKDSNMTDITNTLIAELIEDGTLPALAEKYEIVLAD